MKKKNKNPILIPNQRYNNILGKPGETIKQEKLHNELIKKTNLRNK